MKKKGIIIGTVSAIAATAAGIVAFKNKDKIKNKVKSVKDKKCKKKNSSK